MSKESKKSKEGVLMKETDLYPDQNDPDMQLKLYKKREFHYHRIPEKPKFTSYDDIKEYRYNICAKKPELRDHQILLSNFINPNTPYKGILVFHELGSGKTCVGITIAENFKSLVQRYGTKIHVLVPGPLIKENWKESLLMCTGETYLKKLPVNVLIDDAEKKRLENIALSEALQYYRFMSFRSFYKHVLGDKIMDKTGTGEVVYRKTEEGEFERDVSVDRIYNLNNTLLIIDEAHGLTGNSYGEAVSYIIKNSVNLKVVLMTATPMKNLASDLIELINLIRPEKYPLEKEKIFTGDLNYHMTLKEDGIDYLRKMISGYVSYIRGADPLVYAKRIDVGTIPQGLKFSKLIRCHMSPFQKTTYLEVKKIKNDSLDKNLQAVSNFIFPIWKHKLIGAYGNQGIEEFKIQLKNNSGMINQKISSLLNKKNHEFAFLSHDNKSITGDMLKLKYLKTFSTKFYNALIKINKLIYGKKGVKTAFVYSNLVKVGIELFQEILQQNGYLEFQKDFNSLQITDETICYFCGNTHKNHKNTHKFMPATFLVITGKTSEESIEDLPEEKKEIIKNTFNKIENKDGKYIKLILGSKVLSEGISLFNIGEVHILDAPFHLGRNDQVIGRAIRFCSHYSIMSEKNKFPVVKVYKYVIKADNELSIEEELYRKAELKYLLIKKVERILKEEAIDCPLHMAMNISKDEIDKYKDCKEGLTCPAICDFTNCNYVCSNKILNDQYYDPDRNIYKIIKNKDLDYSTYTQNLSTAEINLAKRKIKEMYFFNYMYQLDEIIDYVKNNISKDKKDLFDEFFVYKALDEMIPITENDFNTFKDTIIDKHCRPGYLIYVNKFYIFQPFNQKENISMYYRINNPKYITPKISILHYIESFTNIKLDENIKQSFITPYDYDSTMEYYDNREEFKYVGYIDKEINRTKGNIGEDVFKLREKRNKILELKRATGVSTIKGAVCTNAKNKEYLNKVGKEFGIHFEKSTSRNKMCQQIQNKMIELEKYSHGKDKLTYIMIPKNHPTFKFPLNIEDRTANITEILNKQLKINTTIKKKLKSYVIEFKDTKKLNDYKDILQSYNAKKINGIWNIVID